MPTGGDLVSFFPAPLHPVVDVFRCCEHIVLGGDGSDYGDTSNSRRQNPGEIVLINAADRHDWQGTLAHDLSQQLDTDSRMGNS